MLEDRLEDWVKNASKADKVLTLPTSCSREKRGSLVTPWVSRRTSSKRARAGSRTSSIVTESGAECGTATAPSIKNIAHTQATSYQMSHSLSSRSRAPHPINTDDEGDAQALAAAEDENIPPTSVQGMQSSLGLILDPWAKPIEPESARADQSVIHSFDSSSPSHLGYPSYDDATTVTADHMLMDMQAGSGADEAHTNEVALMPYPPGFTIVPAIELMDDHEAELRL